MFWPVVLVITAVIWFIDAVAVWFGFHPSTFTMSVAFISAGILATNWAIEEWKANEK